MSNQASTRFENIGDEQDEKSSRPTARRNSLNSLWISLEAQTVTSPLSAPPQPNESLFESVSIEARDADFREFSDLGLSSASISEANALYEEAKDAEFRAFNSAEDDAEFGDLLENFQLCIQSAKERAARKKMEVNRIIERFGGNLRMKELALVFTPLFDVDFIERIGTYLFVFSELASAVLHVSLPLPVKKASDEEPYSADHVTVVTRACILPENNRLAVTLLTKLTDPDISHLDDTHGNVSFVSMSDESNLVLRETVTQSDPVGLASFVRNGTQNDELYWIDDPVDLLGRVRADWTRFNRKTLRAISQALGTPKTRPAEFPPVFEVAWASKAAGDLAVLFGQIHFDLEDTSVPLVDKSVVLMDGPALWHVHDASVTQHRLKFLVQDTQEALWFLICNFSDWSAVALMRIRRKGATWYVQKWHWLPSSGTIDNDWIWGGSQEEDAIFCAFGSSRDEATDVPVELRVMQLEDLRCVTDETTPNFPSEEEPCVFLGYFTNDGKMIEPEAVNMPPTVRSATL